uniref:RNA-dependent RNA polymerase n=1 Tax=Rhizoctonia cerealis zetahypovirus TaxID=3068673 RepID=A0AA51GK15_9VIRU|nr:MAG: RNA-dependent RNA polymerase [Rhizoctonia cerealis zetahypovirus]
MHTHPTPPTYSLVTDAPDYTQSHAPMPGTSCWLSLFSDSDHLTIQKWENPGMKTQAQLRELVGRYNCNPYERFAVSLHPNGAITEAHIVRCETGEWSILRILFSPHLRCYLFGSDFSSRTATPVPTPARYPTPVVACENTGEDMSADACESCHGSNPTQCQCIYYETPGASPSTTDPGSYLAPYPTLDDAWENTSRTMALVICAECRQNGYATCICGYVDRYILMRCAWCAWFALSTTCSCKSPKLFVPQSASLTTEGSSPTMEHPKRSADEYLSDIVAPPKKMQRIGATRATMHRYFSAKSDWFNQPGNILPPPGFCAPRLDWSQEDRPVPTMNTKGRCYYKFFTGKVRLHLNNVYPAYLSTLELRRLASANMAFFTHEQLYITRRGSIIHVATVGSGVPNSPWDLFDDRVFPPTAWIGGQVYEHEPWKMARQHKGVRSSTALKCCECEKYVDQLDSDDSCQLCYEKCMNEWAVEKGCDAPYSSLLKSKPSNPAPVAARSPPVSPVSKPSSDDAGSSSAGAKKAKKEWCPKCRNRVNPDGHAARCGNPNAGAALNKPKGHYTWNWCVPRGAWQGCYRSPDARVRCDDKLNDHSGCSMYQVCQKEKPTYTYVGRYLRRSDAPQPEPKTVAPAKPSSDDAVQVTVCAGADEVRPYRTRFAPTTSVNEQQNASIAFLKNDVDHIPDPVVDECWGPCKDYSYEEERLGCYETTIGYDKMIRKTFGTGFNTTWNRTDSSAPFALLTAPPTNDPLAGELDGWRNRSPVRVHNSWVRYFGGACGTGKTIYAPAFIKDPKRVLIITIPRIAAVENAVSYYTRTFRVFGRAGGRNIGNVDNVRKAELVICTTGSVAAQIRSYGLTPALATMMIDEAHDSDDPTNHEVFTYATKAGFDITLTTATPAGAPFPVPKKLAQSWSFHTSHANYQGYNATEPERELVRAKTGAVNAVVCPVLEIADAVMKSLVDAPSAVAIARVSRKLGVVASQNLGKMVLPCNSASITKVIQEAARRGLTLWLLCTPVIEVGVTIPELDLVVECGVQLDVSFNLGALAQGKPGTSRDTAARSWSSAVQVAGRVSRVKSGHAMILGAGALEHVPNTSYDAAVKLAAHSKCKVPLDADSYTVIQNYGRPTNFTRATLDMFYDKNRRALNNREERVAAAYEFIECLVTLNENWSYLTSGAAHLPTVLRAAALSVRSPATPVGQDAPIQPQPHSDRTSDDLSCGQTSGMDNEGNEPASDAASVPEYTPDERGLQILKDLLQSKPGKMGPAAQRARTLAANVVRLRRLQTLTYAIAVARARHRERCRLQIISSLGCYYFIYSHSRSQSANLSTEGSPPTVTKGDKDTPTDVQRPNVSCAPTKHKSSEAGAAIRCECSVKYVADKIINYQLHERLCSCSPTLVADYRYECQGLRKDPRRSERISAILAMTPNQYKKWQKWSKSPHSLARRETEDALAWYSGAEITKLRLPIAISKVMRRYQARANQAMAMLLSNPRTEACWLELVAGKFKTDWHHQVIAKCDLLNEIRAHGKSYGRFTLSGEGVYHVTPTQDAAGLTTDEVIARLPCNAYIGARGVTPRPLNFHAGAPTNYRGPHLHGTPNGSRYATVHLTSPDPAEKEDLRTKALPRMPRPYYNHPCASYDPQRLRPFSKGFRRARPEIRVPDQWTPEKRADYDWRLAKFHAVSRAVNYHIRQGWAVTKASLTESLPRWVCQNAPITARRLGIFAKYAAWTVAAPLLFVTAPLAVGGALAAGMAVRKYREHREARGGNEARILNDRIKAQRQAAVDEGGVVRRMTITPVKLQGSRFDDILARISKLFKKPDEPEVVAPLPQHANHPALMATDSARVTQRPSPVNTERVPPSITSPIAAAALSQVGNTSSVDLVAPNAVEMMPPSHLTPSPTVSWHSISMSEEERPEPLSPIKLTSAEGWDLAKHQCRIHKRGHGTYTLPDRFHPIENELCEDCNHWHADGDRDQCLSGVVARSVINGLRSPVTKPAALTTKNLSEARARAQAHSQVLGGYSIYVRPDRRSRRAFVYDPSTLGALACLPFELLVELTRLAPTLGHTNRTLYDIGNSTVTDAMITERAAAYGRRYWRNVVATAITTSAALAGALISGGGGHYVTANALRHGATWYGLHVAPPFIVQLLGAMVPGFVIVGGLIYCVLHRNEVYQVVGRLTDIWSGLPEHLQHARNTLRARFTFGDGPAAEVTGPTLESTIDGFLARVAVARQYDARATADHKCVTRWRQDAVLIAHVEAKRHIRDAAMTGVDGATLAKAVVERKLSNCPADPIEVAAGIMAETPTALPDEPRHEKPLSDQQGYCYLALFQQEYQAAVLAQLGPYPTVRDILAITPYKRSDWDALNVWRITGSRYLHAAAKDWTPPPKDIRYVISKHWRVAFSSQMGSSLEDGSSNRRMSPHEDLAPISVLNKAEDLALTEKLMRLGDDFENKTAARGPQLSASAELFKSQKHSENAKTQKQSIIGKSQKQSIYSDSDSDWTAPITRLETKTPSETHAPLGCKIDPISGNPTVDRTLRGLESTVEAIRQYLDDAVTNTTDSLLDLRTALQRLLRSKISTTLRFRVAQILDIPVLRTNLFFSAVRTLLDALCSSAALEDMEAQSAIDVITPILLYKRRMLSQFSEQTRHRPKPAWALMFPTWEPSRQAEARVRYPKDKGVDVIPMNLPDTSADFNTVKRWHSELLAPTVRKSVSFLMQETQRRINRNPYVDTWIAPVARAHPLFDGVPDGVDGLAYATPENIFLSMQRYGPRDETPYLTIDEVEAIASAMYWRNPELYGHAELLAHSTRKIIKNLHSSPGYPLLGMRMRKNELQAEGLLDPLVSVAYNSLKTPQSYVGINHVFPKSQVLKREKVSIPGKLRTIVGVPLTNQVRGRVINGDINDRRAPWDAPGKPGMPSTGRAFNKLYQNVKHRQYHYSLDGTAYDSNVKKQIIDVSTRIRYKGYEWHPDADLIHAALHAVQATVFNGHLVNLVADEGEFRYLWKEGGIATGHESVTEDNTQTLQVCIIATLSKVWNCSPGEVLSRIDLENVGDDNFLHTDVPINHAEFQRVAKLVTGVDFKFEDATTEVTGIEFLSKTGYDMTDDIRKELTAAGVEDVDSLDFFVTHNRSTLLMRLAHLRLDGHTTKVLSKTVTRSEYFIQRAIGYTYLTAHQKDIYDFIYTDGLRLLQEAPMNPLLKAQFVASFVADQEPAEKARVYQLFKIDASNLPKLKKELRLPSYAKILRVFYAPLDPNQNRKGLVSRSIVLWDHWNTRAYKMDRNLRKVARIVSSIDPEVYDIPDPLARSDIPLSFTGWWRSNYEIEHFIFWRYMERQYAEDEDPTTLMPEPPTFEVFAELCRQSPFFGQTDAAAFCQSHVPRLMTIIHDSSSREAFVIRETVRRKFRMTLLTIFYSILVTGINTLPPGFMSIAPLLFSIVSQGQRRLYSYMSYAYWFDQGQGSHYIANLSPKDAYGAHKRISIDLLALWPEHLYLPDLFLGKFPNQGLVLEQVAKAIMFVNGLGSRKVGKESLTANNEISIQTNPWVAETELVVRALEHPDNPVPHTIILDAPTGSGKTFWFPMALLEIAGFTHADTSVTAYDTVVVVVPTNILAQETKWLKSSRYSWHWVKRVSRTAPPAVREEHRFAPGNSSLKSLSVMTAGHADAIWEQLAECDNRTTIFQLDEYHFQQPAQLRLVHRLRARGFRVVISTATPSLNIDKSPYQTFHSTLKRKFDIQTIPVTATETWAFDAVMKSQTARDKGFADRILIIHPSVKKGTEIVQMIRDRANMYESLTGGNFMISQIHAGDRRVPSTGHIVATQMVDAGVTIKGITCVIDSGLSIVSHMNSTQWTTMSTTTSIQRKGRTGRTDNGLYIPLRTPHTQTDAINLPSNFELITDFTTWQSIYASTIRLKTIFSPYLDRAPNQINKYCRYSHLESDVPDTYDRLRILRDANIFLEVLLIHANTNSFDEMLRNTATDYNSLKTEAPRESVAHLKAKGRTPEVAIERFQEALAADRFVWSTIYGPAPGVPRCSQGVLNLAAFTETNHPARCKPNGEKPAYSLEIYDRLEGLLAGLPDSTNHHIPLEPADIHLPSSDDSDDEDGSVDLAPSKAKATPDEPRIPATVTTDARRPVTHEPTHYAPDVSLAYADPFIPSRIDPTVSSRTAYAPITGTDVRRPPVNTTVDQQSAANSVSPKAEELNASHRGVTDARRPTSRSSLEQKFFNARARRMAQTDSDFHPYSGPSPTVTRRQR